MVAIYFYSKFFDWIANLCKLPRYWLQLKIKWVPSVYCCVASDSKIGKKKLQESPGFVIFENKNTQVLPLNYLGSPLCAEISAFSARAIRKHGAKLNSNQVSIRQRQTIKVVPIAECHYRSEHSLISSQTVNSSNSLPQVQEPFAENLLRVRPEQRDRRTILSLQLRLLTYVRLWPMSQKVSLLVICVDFFLNQIHLLSGRTSPLGETVFKKFSLVCLVCRSQSERESERESSVLNRKGKSAHTHSIAVEQGCRLKWRLYRTSLAKAKRESKEEDTVMSPN